MGEAKILLVEDEAPIREGLKARLEQEGYRVVAVETREARPSPRSRGAPDLVILDRRLPDGEGLDVLTALRASERAGTRVIVLSARGMAEDRIAGLEGGADDYVTKPFNLRELLARVQAVLARGPRQDEAGAARIGFGSFTPRRRRAAPAEGAQGDPALEARVRPAPLPRRRTPAARSTARSCSTACGATTAIRRRAPWTSTS